MQAAVENEKGVFCKDHPEEDCTFVCELCESLICDDCIDSNNHKDHDISSIKNFIKNLDLDKLRSFCDETEPEAEKVRKKALAESEKKIQRAVDAITAQANQMVSEIIRIKESKIRECQKKNEDNLAVVNNIVAFMDTSKIKEQIKNLPTKGGRTQYARVANEVLSFHKGVDYACSDDFNLKCEGTISIPNFTAGKIKITRLEQLFGELDFEEEDVNDQFDSSSNSNSSTDSSDCEETEESDSDSGEKETGSDFLAMNE